MINNVFSRHRTVDYISVASPATRVIFTTTHRSLIVVQEIGTNTAGFLFGSAVSYSYISAAHGSIIVWNKGTSTPTIAEAGRQVVHVYNFFGGEVRLRYHIFEMSE